MKIVEINTKNAAQEQIEFLYEVFTAVEYNVSIFMVKNKMKLTE